MWRYVQVVCLQICRPEANCARGNWSGYVWGRVDKTRSLRLCACLSWGPGARLRLEGYVYRSKEHSSKALHQESWQEGKRHCITEVLLDLFGAPVWWLKTATEHLLFVGFVHLGVAWGHRLTYIGTFPRAHLMYAEGKPWRRLCSDKVTQRNSAPLEGRRKPSLENSPCFWHSF